MTEALISRLSDQGYNLVIEGTGRTTDVPIQTATMLQSKGYETKMYVTAVPKIESYLGTIERYETMYADDPRPSFHHHSCADRLPPIRS